MLYWKILIISFQKLQSIPWNFTINVKIVYISENRVLFNFYQIEIYSLKKQLYKISISSCQFFCTPNVFIKYRESIDFVFCHSDKIQITIHPDFFLNF